MSMPRKASFPDASSRLTTAMTVGALAGLLVAPASAAPVVLGSKISNDMNQCAPGKGPAIRLDITGLKSSAGNLFIRTYYARSGDWLKSRRYIHRIETRPRQGTTTVCVPLPAAGDYAITVDGAGVSNNVKFGNFLGLIPRPPGVEKARFTAGPGVSRMTIMVQYQ
jgi:hypothetical protein